MFDAVFALLLTLARAGRIDELSGGLCKSDDFEVLKKRMAKCAASDVSLSRRSRR